MTIKCRICDKEFNKQITNSHLKSHNITTKEYKELYGNNSLTSVEYREQLSEKRKGENNSNYGKKWTNERKEKMSQLKQGNVPWNKGKTFAPSQKLLDGIARREEKYINGELVRHSGSHKENTKQKISKAISEYALNHPEELSSRAKKAIETKKSNGYDLAFFRGRKHKSTSLTKIAISAKRNNDIKTQQSYEKRLDRIKQANLTLISMNDEIHLQLKCNTCNTYFTRTKQIFIDSKFKEKCCPTCFPCIQPKRSVQEKEIYDFVKSLCPSAISNYKITNSKKEVDIFIPEFNLAVEHNGLYWHSEQLLISMGKDKTSDNEKRKLINSLGLRYIGIFEDEWINKQDIVKSRLKHILKKIDATIYARKCILKEISSREASLFCQQNHIQGKGRSNIRYGLYYNDELVSLMTFTNTNLSRKSAQWEINRFCSKLNLNVVGSASKLFARFIKHVNPEKVISYADSRWSNGDLYKSLGFTHSHDTVPNYWYFNGNSLQRIHRFVLRKRQNESKSISEMKLREEQGYLRIWDCGSSKWIWTKKDAEK